MYGSVESWTRRDKAGPADLWRVCVQWCPAHCFAVARIAGSGKSMQHACGCCKCSQVCARSNIYGMYLARSIPRRPFMRVTARCLLSVLLAIISSEDYHASLSALPMVMTFTDEAELHAALPLRRILPATEIWQRHHKETQDSNDSCPDLFFVYSRAACFCVNIFTPSEIESCH